MKKHRIMPAVVLSGLLLSIGPDMVLSQFRTMQQRTEFRDGTYSAKGKYGGQPSFITVTVILKDGVIRSVRVTPHAYVPTSLQLQRRFAAAVPRVVVGRPISGLKVGKLAGSSGTPEGFNDALEQIRKQAAK